TGTFPLTGLSPGTYCGTWWDTFVGRAISNFPFTVSGTLDSPSISTPAILRSMAFFAAKPPAAGSIAGPEFSQVLGTNSPPLTLNLQIPNTGPAGGLPLLYSL